MFSNFSDPSRNIVPLFDSMEANVHEGWANLTFQIATAWQYVARHTKGQHPHHPKYHWYVKMDPDTFVRPEFLPARLKPLERWHNPVVESIGYVKMDPDTFVRPEFLPARL